MIYRNLHASIMRFCQEFATSFVGGVTPTFENFDASWQEAELPDNDLIGYFALTYTMNDHFVEGSVQIGYSVKEDKNLFRLVNAIDTLASHLKPTDKLPIYDADTGSLLGHMVCTNGTSVFPVAGSKTRPVQFIGVNFLTTTTYQIEGTNWSGSL